MAAVAGPLAIVAGAEAASPPSHLVQGGGVANAGYMLGFTGLDYGTSGDRGEVQVIKSNGVPLNGYVTCVDVLGNKAVLTGKLRNDHTGNPYFRVRVQDNGEPNNPGNTSPDRVQFSQTNSPELCTRSTPNDVLVAGDVQVR
jgi:hypothetical protein